MTAWVASATLIVASGCLVVVALQWPTHQTPKSDLSASATKSDSSVGGRKVDSPASTNTGAVLPLARRAFLLLYGVQN